MWKENNLSWRTGTGWRTTSWGTSSRWWDHPSSFQVGQADVGSKLEVEKFWKSQKFHPQVNASSVREKDVGTSMSKLKSQGQLDGDPKVAQAMADPGAEYPVARELPPMAQVSGEATVLPNCEAGLRGVATVHPQQRAQCELITSPWRASQPMAGPIPESQSVSRQSLRLASGLSPHPTADHHHWVAGPQNSGARGGCLEEKLLALEKQAGRSATLPKALGGPWMVERACPPGKNSPYYTGRDSRKGATPSFGCSPTSKDGGGNFKSYRNFTGLRKIWGSKNCGPKNFKVLSPVVCHFQSGRGHIKDRLISDCRKLNQFLTPQQFRLDHLQNIFPYLRKGQWGAKIDLKDAYFHLPLGKDLRPYVHLAVGGQVWEFQAACFGLSTLPQKFMSLMRVFEKLWRKKGIQCFVYLDDILVIGNSPTQVRRDLGYMVQTLSQGGMKINVKKSILEPSQEINHLGSKKTSSKVVCKWLQASSRWFARSWENW